MKPKTGTPKTQIRIEGNPIIKLNSKCCPSQHLTYKSFCSQYCPSSNSMQKYKLVTSLVIVGCSEYSIIIIDTVTYLENVTNEFCFIIFSNQKPTINRIPIIIGVIETIKALK